MRVTPALLSLGTLAAAQQQIPLVDQVKGWFAKATAAASSYVPTNTPSIPNPVAAGAAAVASSQVEKLTLNNFKEVLRPGAATASPGIETWMVYLTGANKTCFGRCGHADEQWKLAVPRIVASKNAPNLASIDCEAEPVLCHAWAAGPPAVYYMQLPQPAADQSQPSSTVYYHQLNRTTTSAAEIAALHTEEKYKTQPPYEGVWQPFDGPLAKTGTNVILAYVIWGFAQIPSWAFMVGVSMISRTFMNRRMGATGPAGAPPGGAQRPAQRPSR